jgi:hypothetical protein
MLINFKGLLNKRLTNDTYGDINSQYLLERSHHMPGSYPDPSFYADTAIQILEEAYQDNQESYTGTLILKAIVAISRLKDEIKVSSQQRLFEFDDFEIDDSNSAV